MTILAYILIFTVLGSVVSLIGGIILLSREKFAIKIAHYLSSFAAGVLLATAFLDLLPEALAKSQELGNGGEQIFFLCLGGLLLFFLLERFIHWFHHHHEHTIKESKTTVALINLGDGIHNFVDGVVIAGTFLVSIPLGIVTTLAVAAHEIPQEIGDFGVMLHRGIKRKKILFFNFISALASIAGAVLTFFIGESIHQTLPLLLSLAAGFFIYIAASDLIPEIHNEDRRGVALIETILLLLGVIIVWFAVTTLEGTH